MLGFPVSISSFVRLFFHFNGESANHTSQRQQLGRAGRRSRDSLAILIADRFPVDQQFVQSPDELFENTHDDVNIDLESKILLEGNVLTLRPTTD